MYKTLISLCLIVFTAISAQQAIAHGGATGIVKERMDLMENMKSAVKEVSAIFKGKTEYNAETIRAAAETIRDHSGETMTRLFPDDSLSMHSEAKPLIWKEWQRFKKLADRQANLAEGLFRAANNRQIQVTTSQNMMGQSSTQHMMGSQGMMGQQNPGQMMGSNNMMGTDGLTPMDDPEHLAQMPSSMVFKMLTDNCGSCHESYRIEKD